MAQPESGWERFRQSASTKFVKWQLSDVYATSMMRRKLLYGGTKEVQSRDCPMAIHKIARNYTDRYCRSSPFLENSEDLSRLRAGGN